MVQTSNDEEPAESSQDAQLALHVRRHRQRYRDRQLGQEDLALLTGLSGRQIRSFEKCRRLPAIIDTLLRVAIALEIPLESLIAPSLIAERTRAIEARREAFHDT